MVLMETQKVPVTVLGSRALICGGERGIRTLDTLPYTHFPGVLLRPLGHLTLGSGCCGQGAPAQADLMPGAYFALQAMGCRASISVFSLKTVHNLHQAPLFVKVAIGEDELFLVRDEVLRPVITVFQHHLSVYV